MTGTFIMAVEKEDGRIIRQDYFIRMTSPSEIVDHMIWCFKDFYGEFYLKAHKEIQDKMWVTIRDTIANFQKTQGHCS
jgi:hypothetical protein